MGENCVSLIGEMLERNKISIYNKTIILYGGGQIGIASVDEFSAEANVFFCDSDFSKIGKTISGRKCISIDEAKTIDDKIILVTTSTRSYNQIFKQFENCEIYPYFLYFYQKYRKYYDEILDLLVDEESKNSYLNCILGRISGDETYFRNIFANNQYFCLPEFRYPDNPPNFIDCGAYCGDSIEAFINSHYGNVKKIYGFEPGDKQFRAARNRLKRIRKEWGIPSKDIKIIKYAVSDINSDRRINIENKVGTSFSISDGTFGKKIKCVTLDSYFGNIELKGRVFIKVDIEGAELSMLQGSINFIKKYHPVMAICLYHKAKDFYEIPNFIKEINPNYKFYLRHHSYSDTETVLYCV